LKPTFTFRGFTLPELLVAVALLGIISVLSWRGTDGLQRAISYSELNAGRWKALARGLDRLVLDIRQPSLQPVQAAIGGNSPWIGTHGSSGDDSFVFIRQPLAAGHAPQQIGYRLAEHRLELLLWPPHGAAPQVHTLIEAISRFDVRYLGNDQLWHEKWPAANPTELPKAVSLRVQLDEGGEIERIVAIP
jgi:general secretion pathway protein J